MNNSIQDLLNLAKVDNSRETFDKLADALEIAIEALDYVISASHDVDTYAFQKIQQINKIAKK